MSEEKRKRSKVGWKIFFQMNLFKTSEFSDGEPGHFFNGSALGSPFNLGKKVARLWLPLWPKKALALALARLRLWLF
jgi:hypothetical protein